MRVYISVDMEGVAGVVDESHWLIGQPNYPRSCDLMVAEANAAIEGALAAGAEEIVVNDSHHHMANLDPAKVHPAAQLILGRVKPLSMCQGMGPGFDAALFVGYHAGRGAQRGCIDHTYTFVLHRVTVNGRPVNEGILNGLVAGHFGCPVVFVSGDQTLRAEMVAWNPKIRCCVVKESLGRQAVKSVHPDRACALIREGAERAVRDRGGIPPLTAEAPITLEIELHNAQMADLLERVPFVERLDGTHVRTRADDALTMFRHFLTIMTMASTVKS